MVYNMEYHEELNKTKEFLYKKRKSNFLSESPIIECTSDKIRTGLISIDYILGGGFSRSRLVEVHGHEGRGKTSFVLQCIKQAQDDIENVQILYVDAELSLDIIYVLKLGIKINLNKKYIKILKIPEEYHHLICLEGIDLYRPADKNKSGEDTLDMILDSVRMGIYDYIIVDSKDALLPEAEQEAIDKEGFTKDNIGLQSRMFSKFCRVISAHLGETKTIIVMISQIREKIGIAFGNPEVVAGGRALIFYYSTRLSITGGSAIKEADNIIGRKVTIKTIKHKLYPGPGLVTQACIFNNIGFDIYENLVDSALTCDIIKRSGIWYTYKEHKIQGKANVPTYIKDNNLFEELYQETWKIMNQ